MSQVRTFRDYAQLDVSEHRGFCKQHRTMLVDGGIADDGVPGVWVHCRPCHTFYCPVNPRHKLTGASVRWRDGRTASGLAKVANCLVNTCGDHFDKLERTASLLAKTPRGAEAQELLAYWRDLIERSSGLWAQQAKVMLQLFTFKTKVEPQWIAEERTAQREREMAAEKIAAAQRQAAELAAVEERAARRAELAESSAARWGAYVGSGLALSESAPDLPSVEDLLAQLRQS